MKCSDGPNRSEMRPEASGKRRLENKSNATQMRRWKCGATPSINRHRKSVNTTEFAASFAITALVFSAISQRATGTVSLTTVRLLTGNG